LEDVMNKRMLSIITALTVAAGIFGIAGADTVPANMGRAAIGTQQGSFNLGLNGAVTATGGFSGLRAWQIGLPLDIFGPRIVTVTSRASSLTNAPRWFVVTVNQSGTVFVLSPPAFFPLSPAPVHLQATRGNFAPPDGVCYVLALMNNGSSIATVNYNM
jgi:hypothetical protein